MNAPTFVRRSAGAAFLAAFVALPAMADSSDFYTNQLNSARYHTYNTTQPAYASVDETAGDLFQLTVRNGEVINGPSAISVDHGNQVTLVIDSDSRDVVTVDGYGYTVPVAPGEPAIISFKAERPGRFAYRLTRADEQLGVLEVGPAIRG